MRFDETKNKFGYPCIFCKSTEEAVGNLLRLIMGKQPGFDQGAAVWRATLKEWLEGNYPLLDLNYCGASFSEEQWKAILQGVVKGLERL
jgi:hypothetical protein